jgi:hypothetical protein
LYANELLSSSLPVKTVVLLDTVYLKTVVAPPDVALPKVKLPEPSVFKT